MELLKDPSQIVGNIMDSCTKPVYDHCMWWTEIGLYDLFFRKFDAIIDITFETL